MKLSSAAILLLLSLSSLSTVSAKPKVGDEDAGKNISTKNNKGGKKGTKPSQDDDVLLVVRYRNEKGKNKMKEEANDGTIEMDSKRFKVAEVKTKRSKINKIAKDPNVEAVSESYTYRALPHHGTRGGQAQDERNLAENIPYGIGLVQADQLEQGSSPIKVCIVDTGYGLGHPDLPDASHDIDGFSQYGERWDIDGNRHGTHCAGTIGAIGGNGEGVTSVNPDPNKFTFFIAKGLSDAGSGSSAGVIKAVESCVEAGAKVISMSLGCNNCGDSVSQLAYEAAYNAGALVIAAAGNSGDASKSFPASYKTVMSVGAVDSNMNVAGFSQFNNQVEISGPGVNIYSTITTNSGNDFDYGTLSGTSMATPHVAGVAALVWSHFPDCSNNQIRNVLLMTSADGGSNGCDEYYGYGIVQAKAAYDLLSNEGCTAGGVDSGALSNGAIGGCNQAPDYEPPPTAAPAVFQCDGATVSIQLLTDNYGRETSWELKNSAGSVQASGSGYSSTTDYVETECVSADTCTFTIYDSWGDGMCCGYGSGSYSVTRNGVTFDRDGIFNDSETIDICEGAGTTPPTTSPSDSPSAPTNAPVVPNLWTEISYEDFESGWGIWNRGSDKHSKIDDKYEDALDPNLDATQAVKLKKNKGADSSTFTDVIAVSGYSKMKVDFYFKSKQLNGDGFYLEFVNTNDSNNYNVVQYFQEGNDFVDGESLWYHEIVEFDISAVQNIRVRLRCAADDKGKVWIDHVKLSGQLRILF